MDQVSSKTVRQDSKVVDVDKCPWKVVGRTESVVPTKALIDEFRLMKPCPGDRPLDGNRLRNHKIAISNATFRYAEWASVYCNEDKQTYRVNGKHTSNAMSAFNIGDIRKAGVMVTVTRYEVDNKEDIGKLYGTFDLRGSVRTAGDLNHAVASSCEELKNIRLRVINVAVSAMGLEKFGNDYHIPQIERSKLLLDNKEFVIWLGALLGKSDDETAHIKRAGVVRAMFLTFNKSQSDATGFWAAVRDGSGVDKKVGDRQLWQVLMKTNVHRGRISRKTASQKDLFIMSLKAWNSWRRKETIELLKVNFNEKVPSIA